MLTGYAFATAIIGRPCSWTGSCTAARTSSAWRSGRWPARPPSGRSSSGFLVRAPGLRLVTLAGLALSIGGLLAMSTWTPDTDVEHVALALAAFGLGFGLTVTPRSTAAVEAAGRRLFGVASAVVTVARMVGMAVGLAILTAYGSTTIDRLSDQVYATPDAYLQFIPEELHGRPLRDPLVVDALEAWASREAARIMVGLFVVAAAVTAAAIPPSLVLGGRTRMLTDDAAAPRAASAGGPDPDGDPHPAPRPQPADPKATRAERRRARSTRRHATSSPATTGAIRRRGDGQGRRLREASGPMPWSGCRRSCASPDASVWIDLSRAIAGPGGRGRCRACRSTR